MGKLVVTAWRAGRAVGVLALLGGGAGTVAAAPLGADAVPSERVDEPGPDASNLPGLGAARIPAVTLLWFDPTRALSARGTEIVGEEVRTIFRGLAVDVAFSVAAPETTFGGGPSLEIPVILLRDDPVTWRRAQHVMGLVVREQKPTRAVWAFVTPVRRTLGQDRSLFPVSSGEETSMGRALGRVVAHEVIHAIAPEEPHARTGLMNHSLSRAFLLGPRVDLDAQCSRAFLDRLHALRRPEGGEAPAVAALAAAR
jgi:hypothetical protein